MTDKKPGTIFICRHGFKHEIEKHCTRKYVTIPIWGMGRGKFEYLKFEYSRTGFDGRPIYREVGTKEKEGK